MCYSKCHLQTPIHGAALVHICQAHHPRMLAATAQSKKDQLSYDELMNHEGMNDGILNLKHTPTTPNNKNNKTISIFYFIEIDPGRVTRKSNHSCNSESLEFSDLLDLHGSANRLQRSREEARSHQLCECGLVPRVCAAQGPSRSRGRPDPAAAGTRRGGVEEPTGGARCSSSAASALRHFDWAAPSLGPISSIGPSSVLAQYPMITRP